MRRIAAVALATGVAFASVGAMAADANAAAKGKWATKNGWKAIKADGTYAKNKTRVVVNGYLHDRALDGRSPAVQFLATEKVGKTTLKSYSPTYYVYLLKKGTPPKDGRHWDKKLPHNVFSSTYTQHFYVREGAVIVKTKKIKYGPWKKVY